MKPHAEEHASGQSHYGRLFQMLVPLFMSMYVLMVTRTWPTD